MKKLLLSLLYAVMTILAITIFVSGFLITALYYPILMTIFLVMLIVGSLWAAFYCDMR